MKVFTILGTLKDKEANYIYSPTLASSLSLKKDNYINMFTLLLDNFENITAIYTQKAKLNQIQALKNEFGDNYEYNFDEDYEIKDEYDFYSVISVINKALNTKDDVIIDLTHGFRHIPILATISLVSKSFSDFDHIKHIFFAKELEFREKYEIIDLKEYLEISNLAILLENFSKNYTIVDMKFESIELKALANQLSEISRNILSNSIKVLYENNLLTKLIDDLEKVVKIEKFKSFENEINKIIAHLTKLKSFGSRQNYWMLYSFAKELYEKGYLLNSLTMLNEALGYYCYNKIEAYDEEVKNCFDDFIDNTKAKDPIYQITSLCTKFATHGDKTELYGAPEIQKEILSKNILNLVKNKIGEADKEFRDFINKLKAFRNNLAHANSSDKIDDIRKELDGLFTEFKIFCIKEDILKR